MVVSAAPRRAAKADLPEVSYLRARLASAQVLQISPDAKWVHFGANVTIRRDDGREPTFRIVGEDEADIKAGLLSVTSPLARALIGKHVKDVVEVNTPKGGKSYEIDRVAYK